MLPPIAAFAERSIFQLAFVVADLEAALERYTSALNAGPWRCYTLGAEGHVSCAYRGGPTGFASRLALNDEHAAELGLLVEAVEPPTSMPPIEFRWPG